MSSICPKRKDIILYKNEAMAHLKALHTKTGAGSDFTGWVDLPSRITEEYIRDIEETASHLRKISEIVVVVGIGGSYLGAKAIITALSHNFRLF